MEVHFTPEMEEKLKDLAAQTGSGDADALVQDVINERLRAKSAAYRGRLLI